MNRQREIHDGAETAAPSRARPSVEDLSRGVAKNEKYIFVSSWKCRPLVKMHGVGRAGGTHGWSYMVRMDFMRLCI